MPVVVADTGPLNYLVQIEAIDLLPALFGKVIVPTAVHNELTHPRAPVAVRGMGSKPSALGRYKAKSRPDE